MASKIGPMWITAYCIHIRNAGAERPCGIGCSHRARKCIYVTWGELQDQVRDICSRGYREEISGRRDKHDVYTSSHNNPHWCRCHRMMMTLMIMNKGVLFSSSKMGLFKS